MSYTAEFYEEYREELARPNIRTHHDEMFAAFHELAEFRGSYNVLDLGCGTCEFRRYEKCHGRYFGIDKYHKEPGMPCQLGDYSEATGLCPFDPTAFISLFSTELV